MFFLIRKTAIDPKRWIAEMWRFSAFILMKFLLIVCIDSHSNSIYHILKSQSHLFCC